MKKSKLGRYSIERYAMVSWWQLNVLPALEISYDKSGIYVVVSFLFFEAYIAVIDEVREQEWIDKYFKEEEE
jgi:hypothetical protein